MPPDSALESHHFEALGTSCALFAVAQPLTRLMEGELWVRRIGARFTRFSAESELSRLNASPGRWIPVGGEIEAVLRAALLAYDSSGGLVNVAVLPSMLAVGYTRTLSEGPTVAVLESARPLPSLPDVLRVRDGEAWLEPGAGLDLGGVAKGWMADRLCQWLGPNVLANLGGDLMARGARAESAAPPVGRRSSPDRSAQRAARALRPGGGFGRGGNRVRGGGRRQDGAAARTRAGAHLLRRPRARLVARRFA